MRFPPSTERLFSKALYFGVPFSSSDHRVVTVILEKMIPGRFSRYPYMMDFSRALHGFGHFVSECLRSFESRKTISNHVINLKMELGPHLLMGF